MSNYTAIRELLSRISGQDNTFTVPKVYVDYAGDITTAILLNQIVFYSDKSKRTDGFFYKTYKEWEEDVCLSERQVRYSVKKLKDKGILETKLMKANGSPTVHYRLFYDKFVDSILTFCQNPIQQSVSIQTDILSDSLTESTTEKTTENIHRIFQYWNSKKIVVHRSMNKAMKSNINARLKDYDLGELMKAIDNFKTVLDGEDYYWSHKWTLEDFMKPNNVIRFTDDSKPLESFASSKKKKNVQTTSNEEYHSDSVDAGDLLDMW